MKTFVITIKGLRHSEQQATVAARSAAAQGLTAEQFAATNRYKARKTMDKLGLFLNPAYYARLADNPIGDRANVAKGEWSLTTPELGCFLSHYRLWLKATSLEENILILEHDSYLLSPIPDFPDNFLAVNLHNREFPGTVGYIITPRGAQRAIDEAKANGIQPSDELLWRSALRKKMVFTPENKVMEIRDNGISTIQWTRSDEEHEHISKKDPWQDFRGRKTGFLFSMQAILKPRKSQ
jgi:GR25 family glycosyltransferase involved in LPS biosynthesis